MGKAGTPITNAVVTSVRRQIPNRCELNEHAGQSSRHQRLLRMVPLPTRIGAVVVTYAQKPTVS